MDCGGTVWVAVDDPEGHAASVERVGISGEGDLVWVFEVLGMCRKSYSGLSRFGT